MNQTRIKLFLCLSLLLALSCQSQLIRDLSGLTDQNLLAQAAQWTLSDPSGTQYPMITTECISETLLVKSSSLPTGSSFKRTYTNLPDHNTLRFFVRMYYMGPYTDQTVDIKIGQEIFATSQVKKINSWHE